MNGEVKFVLYRSVEHMSGVGLFVIVNTALREEISDLLIEPSFGCANFADPLNQLFEIVLPEKLGALLQTVVVKRESLHQILFQNSSCPNPEFGCIG
ncbi:hypothetical protein D3C72_1921100 [compost metagenome]